MRSKQGSTEANLDGAATLLAPRWPDISGETVAEALDAWAQRKTTPDMENRPQARYLPIVDAAPYSGMSRWTLGRLAKSGRLPVIKLPTPS